MKKMVALFLAVSLLFTIAFAGGMLDYSQYTDSQLQAMYEEIGAELQKRKESESLTYTATATIYALYGSNPSLVNYQYAYATEEIDYSYIADIEYMMTTSFVLDEVMEKLLLNYKDKNLDTSLFTSEFIRSSLSISHLENTPSIMIIKCTTRNPRYSADICNAFLDVAPKKIIGIMSGGSIEVIEYAEVPTEPDPQISFEE